ncbi:MAG: hypothetical protein JJ863_09445 [Deltaproteobacteria bacterium]|nr:hypothetical protein [Deltaproteobacteria bacterium]
MRDAALRATLAASFWCALVPSVGAQDAPARETVDAEDEGDQRAAAARAYDRGATAYRGGQYDRAASLFETAYRIAPNSTVLLQAVRAHERSGRPGRAATLAELLVRTYPEPATTAAEAQELLDTLAPGLLRVTFDAGESSPTWEIDGVAQDAEELVSYVAPGAHVLRVTYGEGIVTERFAGSAGETVTVATEPPAAIDSASSAPPPPSPDVPSEDDDGISPWLFATLAGGTAVAAGLAIAFGVNAYTKLDEYEANPTREGLEAGRRRERRTNAMIGVAGGLALTALITAFFTDWGGDDDRTSVSVTASESGAGLIVQGVL